MESVKRLFRAIGRFFKWSVKTVQGIGTFAVGLIVIILFIAVISSVGQGDRPQVPDGAVLVLNPQGGIMEQTPLPKPFETIAPYGNTPPPGESLHDLLRAIRLAEKDERISGLAIYTNSFAGAGPALMYEIADAIRAFKQSQKPVYAISSFYSQSSYLLAAEADKIYVDTDGSVLLEGYAIYPMYYRDMLDKIEATVELFRVGTHKSAVEPYVRNDMSPEVKASNKALLTDLWDSYTSSISKARDGLTPESVNASITDIVERLRQANGDFATMALNTGLVDVVGPPSGWRADLIEAHGAGFDDDSSFNQINHRAYLAAVGPEPVTGSEIAVITAQGLIVPGTGPATVAAAETVSGYIRQAHTNPNTKAIILRVDSGGGSAFASEEIRQELLAAQDKGLPVIASMGSVAASGGYWIAASADRIIASPTTITGSIGIFAIIPTFEKTAKRVGVSVDGVATSDLADGLHPLKTMNDTVRQVIQLNIEDGYRDFLKLVSDHRDMTLEEVDAVGQGQVWLGQKAFELGLVDQLGNFRDAVTAAAEEAQLDRYSVRFYREQQDPLDKFLLDLIGNDAAIAPYRIQNRGAVTHGAVLPQLLAAVRQIEQDFTISDPNGRMLLCMVCRPD